MAQVYELNLWGGNRSEFYSGEGSHNPEIVTPYVDVITSFLTSFKSPITLCDLAVAILMLEKNLLSIPRNMLP